MIFVIGFLGIAFWTRLCKILVPSLKDSKIINWIGSNTFAIMMHHLAGFLILNCCVAVFASTFHIANGFDFVEFKSNIYYQYLPKNLSNFNGVYLVSGIAFSYVMTKLELIVKKGSSKLKSLFKNKIKEFPIF